MNLKKVINSCLLFACVIFVSVAEARTWEQIKKSGVIKVAVDGMTPAFNFYKNGELVGFEVDLAKAIAERLHLKIEWTVQPFNSLLIGLKQDRFDLIAVSHTITPQRSKMVDFIKPHYCSNTYIISKEGGPRTVAELSDKKVAVAVGTVYYDKLASYGTIGNIMTVPGESDGFVALQNDRADAWVTESEIARGALQNAKNKLQLGDAILTQVNAMAVAKGNKELQTIVDGQMQALMNDGTYKQLMQRYVAEDICCR